MGKKKIQRKRVCGLVLAVSMSVGMAAPAFAASPPFAYTEEEWARLRDNVLEYEEIPNLIDEYNVIVQNNDETYKGFRSQKDPEKGREDLEEMADQLYTQADEMESMMAEPMYALLTNSYSQLLYAANSMRSGALQVEQQVDSYIMDGPLLKYQLDHVQEMLTATAQDLMISYEKLLVNEEMVTKTQGLLQEVLASTKRRKELGLATQNDVLSAEANLKNLESSLLQIQGGIRSIHQNLCLLTGWKYDATPEIRKVPEPDLSYLSTVNLQEDYKKALEANYMHNYNIRAMENTTNEADKENLKRTVLEEEQNIPKKVKNLYDAAVQSQREFEKAQSDVQTASENLAVAERQKTLGTIGNLQFLQVQSAYDTAVSSEKTAKLSLFQAIEAYKRAVNGYLAS